MTALQRALREMNRAIYAAAKAARDEKHPDAPILQRMALASDEIVDRNIKVSKP